MSGRAKRHAWRGGDTCVDCGLHREGAGYGPYGAMRYYRDGQSGVDYKPGNCPAWDRLEAELNRTKADAS